MGIGEQIKTYRKEQGLTASFIAEKANISKGFLSDIENGRRKPSMDVLQNIARVLNTTSAYLMGETDNPDPNVFKRVSIPPQNETWREFYERLIDHSPELEFWFRKKGMDLSERDYRMLSNLILSFIKSSREEEQK